MFMGKNMKFWNKMQLFSLLLAALICGQELVHAVFHHHDASPSCRYQRQSAEKPELKSSDHRYQVPNAHIKATCPLCSSAGSKSVPETCLETRIVSHTAVSHPYLNESFIFNSFNQNSSRGPPAA
jgi:hypothetical protein